MLGLSGIVFPPSRAAAAPTIMTRIVGTTNAVLFGSMNRKTRTQAEHHSQNGTLLTVKRLIFPTFYDVPCSENAGVGGSIPPSN
jgi:hypothetical protein